VSNRPLRRPLALVSLLSLGDYLLWNWSFSGSHDVLALVAGLTLTPLLIALIWLLFVGATRLIADTARRTRVRSAASAGTSAVRGRTPAKISTGAVRTASRQQPAGGRHPVAGADAAGASPTASQASKLAA
jgi:hypothetical protein